jgi:hypothetical protein
MAFKSALLNKKGWEGEVFRYVGLGFDIHKAEQIIASSPHTTLTYLTNESMFITCSWRAYK